MSFVRNLWIILKGIGKQFQKDDLFSYSAGIAYYTIFSLPAMLIIILKIASAAYDKERVNNELYIQLSELIGEQSATDMLAIMNKINETDPGMLATVVGIATLVFTSTTVFIAIQSALNQIWGVKPKPKKGWLKLLLNRVLSFAMIISIGFIMLVSLVINTLLVIFNNLIAAWLSNVTVYLMQLINFGISIAVITLIFAMIFKFLPDAKIRWQDVWVGAIFTTVLFLIGRYLIGFYLGNSKIDNVYGAAGSIVVLLLWVNYSTLILLIGAEFTHVYSKFKGHKIKPSEYAVGFVVREIDKADLDLNDDSF